MKNETKFINARLRNPNHPRGEMRRAGFLFTFEVQQYEVTPEEEKIIAADPSIMITDHAPTEKPKKSSKKDSKPVEFKTVEIKQKGKSDPFDHIPANIDLGEQGNAKTEKSTLRMGKDEIIAKLQEKGLKSGEDFDESAKKESLIQLLETL